MKRTTVSERALVLAPRGRDAAIAAAILGEAGIVAEVCPSPGDLIAELDAGAAFVVVTEEALATADLAPLDGWLADQEEWSDLPFVLLTTVGGGLERNPAARRFLDVLGNVTFLERPFHPTTLVSLARSALRGRKRQYEARARLEALHESEGRYRGLFENIDEGFCVIEFFDGPHGPLSDYVHVQANPAYALQAGIPDVVGRKLREMVPDEADGWVELYRRVLVTGEPLRFERELIATGRYLDLAAFRIEPASHRQVAVLFRDVTVRKRAELALREINETLEQRVSAEMAKRGKAEEALRQAQKMEAIGQLTGGVAHDFNNLLTIIKSSTDLLRRPTVTEERKRRYVDAISDTVDRAAKLTGQLLAFARRQALKPELFDAGERIRGIAEMLQTVVGSRVAITTEIGPERFLVEADASQFETALVNMVVNARDAMNGEGSITIRVGAASAPPGLRGDGGPVRSFAAVSLTDTGSGIAPDRLPQIFDPFFTTKEVGKGTGLGLSQVYGFAKQSGGDIAVESEVGRGTTFTLTLPRADGDAAAARPDVEVRPDIAEGQGRRVLVVEDNAEVGTFSTQLLQDLGYETTWAADGAEALSILAEADGFDVVFSDVVMPGMSGVELGQRIRHRHPDLPVVLTSGYSDVLAQEGRHGFELLQKPYAAEELSKVLRRAMRGGDRASG